MGRVSVFGKKYGFRCALVVVLVAASGLAVMLLADFGTVKMSGAGYPVCLGGWRNIAFDEMQWRGADGNVKQLYSRGPGRDNRRARMVTDLISHHLHKGMAKVRVEDMLGRPMAGGDGVELYDLMAFPSLDQKIVAWLRWRSSRPILALTYRGRTGAEKLESAEVL
ncbi:hypothetical protein LLG46_11495 [bacterium]|nr:hypothetical protein [bacterium]